jgi:hypothetical protein
MWNLNIPVTELAIFKMHKGLAGTVCQNHKINQKLVVL